MDVENTFAQAQNVPGSDLLQFCLFGADTSKWDQVKAEMSPLNHVQDGKDYPAFLLFHGDADQIVPYHQMETMYDALTKVGAKVEAYRVKGANHERDFWSQAIYDTAYQFLAPIEHPMINDN